VACLVGAVLAVMAHLGWAERRRRTGLARLAYPLGLQYSEEDLFDLTGRYLGFVLPSAGHSPRAENVVYGRYGDWHLRAFDYHFEVGHGTRRLSRRYGVMAVDTDWDFPRALLWHVDDLGHAPLAAAQAGARIGPWQASGEGAFAAALAEAFSAFAAEPASIQTLQQTVMVFAPVRWKPSELAGRMDRLAAAMESLKKSVAELTAPAQ
jgi:hypothetical protein